MKKERINNETFLKIMTYNYYGEAKTQITGKSWKVVYPLYYIVKNSQDEKTLIIMNEIINNYINISSQRCVVYFRELLDNNGNFVKQYIVKANIPEEISNNIIEIAKCLKNKVEEQKKALLKDLENIKEDYKK